MSPVLNVYTTSQLARCVPHNITQFPELHSPLVLEAELEGKLGHVSIHVQVSLVILEQLQHVAIGLPEEFHPWSQQDTISPLLSSFSTNSAQ